MKKLTALILCLAICFSFSAFVLNASAESASPCDVSGDGSVNMHDILKMKKAICGETKIAENVGAKIISYALEGTYVDAKVGFNSLKPENAFDGNTATIWNPQLSSAADEPYADKKAGVIYGLDDLYTLKTVAITFGSREYYFDFYISGDGEEFTKVASVNAANASNYYNDSYVCTLSGINDAARYIKIVFVSNSGNIATHINFYEIAVAGDICSVADAKFDINGDNCVNVADMIFLVRKMFGTITDEDIPTVPAIDKIAVTGHKLAGEFKDTSDDAANAYKAYDGNTSTKWNATVKSIGKGWIEFTLASKADLTKAVITFDSRIHYFDLYGSEDGEAFVKFASVDAGNQARYTVNREATLDRIIARNVKYVKLVITGNEQSPASLYTNLKEVAFEGRSEPDTRETVKASIIANEINEYYTTPNASTVNKAYDGDAGTKWNPAASFKDGENSEVVFTLDKQYNITKLVLTFASRDYYFETYVSANGSDWTNVANVLKDTASGFYSNRIATVDNLNTVTAKYVKLKFRGSSDNGTWINFQEIEVFGKVVPDTRETVKASVTGHEIVGNYTNAQATSASVGPQKSYDGDAGTKWNPDAKFGDSDNAGIVYTLDKSYNITKLVLTFTGRVYYFDAYVSADNTNWTQIGVSVRSANAPDYYNGYVATFDGLDTDGVQYVKIVFKGGASTFVNFNEFEVFGKAVQ